MNDPRPATSEQEQTLLNMGARHAAEIDSVFYGTGFTLEHEDGSVEYIPTTTIMIDKDGYHIQGREGTFKLTLVRAPELSQ